MTRRFQFSLKALMVATAIASICLGGWQTYTAHFASFVKPETSRVGQPIRLSGRFWLKDGADSISFGIGISSAGSKSINGTSSSKCQSERGRLSGYHFTEPATYLNQPRWTEPGEFDLYVFLPDGHYIAGRVSVKP